VLVGEAWVPAAARGTVADVLRAAAAASSDMGTPAVLSALGAASEPPPTYFKYGKHLPYVLKQPALCGMHYLLCMLAVNVIIFTVQE
jgi:hypothetical protein